jgi:hypothetical protein
VLKNLNARYLKLVVEQPKFIITDTATISDRNPFEVYEEYCQSDCNKDGLEHVMLQLLFKLSGGRVGDSIADIHNEKIEAFSVLMDSMLEDIDELPLEIQDQFSSGVETMRLAYSATLKETENMMKKDIPDDKNWNGIKDFRHHMGIWAYGHRAKGIK